MDVGKKGKVHVEDIVFLIRKDPKKYARVKVGQTLRMCNRWLQSMPRDSNHKDVAAMLVELTIGANEESFVIVLQHGTLGARGFLREEPQSGHKRSMSREDVRKPLVTRDS